MKESKLKIDIKGDLILFYTEIVKIKDIDTQEKLKLFIKELIEPKVYCKETWIVDSSLNLNSDTNNKLKYETKLISNPIDVIPNVEDDEIVFLYVFIFRDSSYSMQIDKNIPIILETFKLDDEEFGLDFYQNNIKLEQDVVLVTNDDCENHIGFYTKTKRLKTINVFSSYEEAENNKDAAIEKISNIISDYLK